MRGRRRAAHLKKDETPRCRRRSSVGDGEGHEDELGVRSQHPKKLDHLPRGGAWVPDENCSSRRQSHGTAKTRMEHRSNAGLDLRKRKELSSSPTVPNKNGPPVISCPTLLHVRMPAKRPRASRVRKWGAAHRQKLHARKLERIERQSASRRQSTKVQHPHHAREGSRGGERPSNTARQVRDKCGFTPRKGGFSPRKSLVLS